MGHARAARLVLAQNPIRPRKRISKQDFGKRVSIIRAERFPLLRSEHPAIVRDTVASRLVKKLDRPGAQRLSGVSIAVPEVVRYDFADGP
jgi:hypothetical protein